MKGKEQYKLTWSDTVLGKTDLMRVFMKETKSWHLRELPMQIYYAQISIVLSTEKFTEKVLWKPKH